MGEHSRSMSPVCVAAIQYGAPPTFISEEPVHCLADSRLKCLFRQELELRHNLRRIDRIPAIMPEPVGDIGDQ